MPLPPEQRIRFFVFVIESPSSVDLYERRSEGDILRQAVQLNGIKCIVKTAISLPAFDACLRTGLAGAMAESPGYMPLLHISAHGSAHGIQLSNESVIPWAALREFLRPINLALHGSLVVCMSSCEGYAGVRMAMHPEDTSLPYYALVGCTGKPTWADTAVAYTAFYHQLYRGEHISDAVHAMCVASGDEGFMVEHAENSRTAYLDYINKLDPARSLATLQALLRQETSDHQQKLSSSA